MSVRGFFSHGLASIRHGARRYWAWSSWRGAPSHADDPVARKPPVKKLIEFGWDEPDTAFLRQHIAEMEQTPFDGCVFHVMSADPQGKRENFTWLGWGRRAFTEAELEPAPGRPQGDDLPPLHAQLPPVQHLARRPRLVRRPRRRPGQRPARRRGRPRGQVRGHPLRRGGVPRAGSSPTRSSGTRRRSRGTSTPPRRGVGAGGHGGVPGGLPRPDRLPDVRPQPAPDHVRGGQEAAGGVQLRAAGAVPRRHGRGGAGRGPARGRLRALLRLQGAGAVRRGLPADEGGRPADRRRPGEVRARRLRRVRALDGLRLAEEGLGRGRPGEELLHARGVRGEPAAGAGAERRVRLGLHRDAPLVVGRGEAGQVARRLRARRSGGHGRG